MLLFLLALRLQTSHQHLTHLSIVFAGRPLANHLSVLLLDCIVLLFSQFSVKHSPYLLTNRLLHKHTHIRILNHIRNMLFQPVFHFVVNYGWGLERDGFLRQIAELVINGEAGGHVFGSDAEVDIIALKDTSLHIIWLHFDHQRPPLLPHLMPLFPRKLILKRSVYVKNLLGIFLISEVDEAWAEHVFAGEFAESGQVVYDLEFGGAWE